MSLATRVLIGFALGVGCGIFFGEIIAPVGVLGDAFIRLLQMTVLPYVVVSLMLGLGRLGPREAAKLLGRAGALLAVIWIVALTVVMLMPVAYPDWEAASFYSTSLVEPTPEIDFVDLFIPANPFNSLAFGKVPAIVLFSLALGAALMGIADKERVLEVLDVVAGALSRVAKVVVRFAPIGVFAITARAAGTLDIAQFHALELYLATYLVCWLVVSLWFLPALTTAFLPVSYREVMGPARDAFVTAFATGNVFVVMPILADHAKKLVGRCAPDSEEATDSVDVLIPLAFVFPGPGTLLILGFVLFAGWLAGMAVTAVQVPTLISSGILALFGSTMAAIPFLLDMLRIPADLFQLYVVSDVFTGRFGMLASAVFTLTWSTLGACAIAGAARVHRRRIIRAVVVTVILVVIGLLGVNAFFTQVVSREYAGGERLATMVLTQPRAEATELDPAALEPPGEEFPSGLDRIRARGAIRVGYRGDDLPFSFRGEDGKLIGHDIDLAHALANDLGVRLELVSIDDAQPAELIADGSIDLVMSGFAVTAERASRMEFTDPYLDLTLAFLVADHRRNEFSSRDSIKAMTDLTVGVADLPFFAGRIQAYVPGARVVELGSPQAFFERTDDEIDAFVYSAEAGSAWSLMYPQFSVAVPQPDVIRIPVAFPLKPGDERLRVFMNTWIEMQRRDGTLDELYATWILGRRPEASAHRWSVIRDVLHWVG